MLVPVSSFPPVMFMTPFATCSKLRWFVGPIFLVATGQAITQPPAPASQWGRKLCPHVSHLSVRVEPKRLVAGIVIRPLYAIFQ
ncbi:hypothetical protein BGW80DRAFT_55817 [Lactifluus volemus]|nr:hypothetical protein BGW80DRAFT_55817 [Lactifluus volemus]